MTANILVVDDIEQNVKLLEAKLLNEYYTVFTANDGFQALEILKKQKIDIVLLDVMMPGMDGFETCRNIKSIPGLEHLPIVMVTALTDIEDKVKGLEAGADEFLSKPVNDTELFARVSSLSRVKFLIDELKIRNKSNEVLGIKSITVNPELLKQSRILLIDDDVVQSKNILKILSDITPYVSVYTDPSKITSASIDVDLVIISCQLEEQDPLRIFIDLHNTETMRYSGFMFIAGEENISMVLKGLRLGLNDYFVYPVDQNELRARVKTQLNKKIYHNLLHQELEEQFNMAIKDGLTNIFNRRYFEVYLKNIAEKLTDTNSSLYLFLLDIDFFKQVNDQYGHQAGDEVLKTFAKTLKNNIRIVDFLARYGGEEFVIIMYDIKDSEALKIAERLRVKVSETEFILSESLIIHKTFSMGIAKLSSDSSKISIDNLIAEADANLYKAKEQGRNRIVYGQTMIAEIVQTLE